MYQHETDAELELRHARIKIQALEAALKASKSSYKVASNILGVYMVLCGILALGMISAVVILAFNDKPAIEAKGKCKP